MAEEREIMLKELKAKVLAWEKTQNFDKEFLQKEDRNFPYFNSQLGKLNKYSQDEATKIVSDFVKYV